ncbi:hypothetical protein [Amycolatopsis iheyensis]|uniref:hypothetical protein n=1 Tax=Amycolatopsis iheyensis TaxID=2945988 RepID=UPI0021525AC5|nr:hypothetical protein [Amycolatopsis iheyensis]
MIATLLSWEGKAHGLLEDPSRTAEGTELAEAAARGITDSIYELAETCRTELDLDGERALARQEPTRPDAVRS